MTLHTNIQILLRLIYNETSGIANYFQQKQSLIHIYMYTVIIYAYYIISIY